ncbi:hypothetical protein CDD83_854 [Cordyceps sp. RAO-2017]|nr:hypothetical protein CDD83_854 [Cordyceps sp. RAO-2017]
MGSNAAGTFDLYKPQATGRGMKTKPGTRSESGYRPGLVDLWKRLDITSRLVLFLGSAVLPLTMIPLLLLWKQSTRAASATEPVSEFFQLVSPDWNTRIVTVCTAVTRTVIAFQASLVAAMIAGIMLEAIGIPLVYASSLSIVRALPIAPANLLYGRGLLQQGLLPSVVYGLVVFEVLITVASQFLSTIYLSDFSIGTYITAANKTQVTYFRTGFLSMPTWTPDVVSRTFAELAEPFAQGPDFHDTGPTYRAFLPFANENERTRLRKFHGPTVVVDTRVVCVRPDVANMTLRRMPSNSSNEPIISGQIAIDATRYPMLKELADPLPLNFSCWLPNSSRDPGISSLCQLHSARTVQLNETFRGSGGYFFRSVLAVFQLTDLPVEPDMNRQKTSRRLDTVRHDGSWAVLGWKPEEVMRVTVCAFDPTWVDLLVDIHSSWEGLEPRIAWEKTSEDQFYWNSKATLRQLGASRTPESPADRGVLTLEPWRWGQVMVDRNLRKPGFSIERLGLQPDSKIRNETVKPRVVITPGGYERESRPDMALAIIYNDTLQATQSPALAMQALLMGVYQAEYYTALMTEREQATAWISFAVTASMPMRWTGFIAAGALIITHLNIVVIVAILYLRLTSNSLIGNAWQAVSQVTSHDTCPMLEKADTTKDSDIKRWARRQSLDMMRRSRVQHRPDGRVALVVQEEGNDDKA